MNGHLEWEKPYLGDLLTMVINHHAFPSVALQQNASQGFSSTSMLPTADFEKTPYQVDFESVWNTQDVTGKPDFLLLKRKQANLVTQGKAATEKSTQSVEW